MSDSKHIEAILTIADREMARPDWHDRCGVFRALLEQAMPFLREMSEDLRDKETALALLRRELEIAESNASERSDPASNADVDEEIRTLRSKIAQVTT